MEVHSCKHLHSSFLLSFAQEGDNDNGSNSGLNYLYFHALKEANSSKVPQVLNAALARPH